MNSTATLVGLHQRGGRPGQPSGPHRDQNEHESKRGPRTTSMALNATRTAVSWRWWVMTVAAFIIAGWTFYFMTTQPPGMDGYEAIRRRILGNLLGVAHVGGGGTAMALGPFQFLKSLRRTGREASGSSRFSVHSWIGRIYAIAVLMSGVGSLDIIKKSDLYTFGALGFLALGSAWVITAILGWRAMWKDTVDINSHKKWMTRNFALTYAAVMLRWQFPLMIILGMDVKLALSWSGWVCWVPNLFFVERYVLGKSQRSSS